MASPCSLSFTKKGITFILGSLYLQALITWLYTDLMKLSPENEPLLVQTKKKADNLGS